MDTLFEKLICKYDISKTNKLAKKLRVALAAEVCSGAAVRESLVWETAAQTKVMMLTSFAKEQMVLAAFAAGTDSYCVKTIKFELLLEALHITHKGQSWIDPAIACIVLKHTRQGAAAAVKPNATQTVTISAIDPEQAFYKQIH